MKHLRRLGPHPVLLLRLVVHRTRRRLAVRRLRQGYDRRIASPPQGAALRLPTVAVPPADELPAALQTAAKRIRAEARHVLDHRVDFLGSGLVDLGPSIDWHADFKSGHRWQPRFYLDVEVMDLGRSSDAKVPWELSRGHQLLTLARAATLFRDEAMAVELEAQLESWLAENPPGQGINWTNPMEAAIRAINWIWALATLEQWRPLDAELRGRVAKSLQIHGRHIAANLEGSPRLRGNHYLSDVVGLLCLGAFLEHDPMTTRWLELARLALEREVESQVLPDGVSFEASLAYHGLALELLLVALVVARDIGVPLSEAYEARLRAMLEVSRSVRHPDGRIPQFGDNDSGRILPASFDRSPRHDHLLWLGAAVLSLPRPLDGEPHEEVAWTLGVDAWQRARTLHPAVPTGSTAFIAGGVYVLDRGGTHVVVRCGDVGQKGNGGHSHNDLLSYELSHGETFVVDSGTYAYTFDVAARNEFRSTRAHNTVVVDGAEINPIAPTAVFELAQYARPRLCGWDPPGRVVLNHDGYRRLDPPVEHRRTFELDEAGALEIADRLEGSGEVGLELFVHLAPGTEVTRIGPAAFGLELRGKRLELEIGGELEVAQTEGWVSDGYGRRSRAPILVGRVRTSLPVELAQRFTPGREAPSRGERQLAEARA